jgi:dTMP kinase
VRPTVSFYYDVPLDEAVKRITEGRSELKYYEAGLDLRLSPDPFESFRLFQGSIQAEYDELVEEFGLVRMDATESFVRQQHKMRKLVQPFLTDVMRTDQGQIQHALQESGLIGRYVNDPRGSWSAEV